MIFHEQTKDGALMIQDKIHPITSKKPCTKKPCIKTHYILKSQIIKIYLRTPHLEI
jgi:hypothetical protein